MSIAWRHHCPLALAKKNSGEQWDTEKTDEKTLLFQRAYAYYYCIYD